MVVPTTSESKPPKVPLPTKATKVVPPMPIPVDLVTPRNFKTAAKGPDSSKPLQPKPDALPPPSNQTAGASSSTNLQRKPNTEALPPNTRADTAPSSTLKRPAENDEPPTRPQQARPAKARGPPPAKRQKQPNLFIPKPNKKVGTIPQIKTPYLPPSCTSTAATRR